jgi:hypothetical protein
MMKRVRKEIPAAQRLRSSGMGLLAVMGVIACAGLTEIPDLDTPDGRVYAQRCGGCHARGHGVPDPRFRTMAQWLEVLPKMDRLIRERALPPLTETERESIIRYLNAHAKS